MERLSRSASSCRIPSRSNLVHGALALLFLCASLPGETRGEPVAAGIPIVYEESHEKTIKVADFPDTENFRAKDGELLDAGYVFKQFRVFWIPVWNYDGRWCCYGQSSGAPYEIQKTNLDVLARAANVSLPAEPELPFWDLYGGKLVGGLLLLFIFASWSAGSEGETASARKAKTASTGAASGPSGRAIAAVPLAVPKVFYVARNGENLGQLTAIDIRKKLADGSLDLDDHYFDPPRNEWVPLRDMRWLS